MKLTKDECLDDVEFIEFFYGDNLIATAELRKEKSKELQEKEKNNLFKRTNRIKQLIQEHFDLLEEYKDCRRELNSYYDMMCNPPLEFEELKENMWVWDNFNKEYNKVYKTYVTDDEDDCYIEGVEIIRFGHEYSWRDTRFEENRFFRKEVKE